ETFVLAQIITAIECGFRVNILVEDLLDIEASKQQVLINQYKIIEKVIIDDPKIPVYKPWRLIKACFLVIIDLPYLSQLIKYLKLEKKLSLSSIYRFHFYKA